MEVRLHKYLANCGLTSRRKAEEMMLDGLVYVNGELAIEPGIKITPGKDVVKVNGKIIRGEKKIYVLLNKPRGFVTTTDDDLGRKTVMDLIEGITERIYPVGRLDRDSEGLLVLTNDGDMAKYLTHPSCEVTKVYRVTVDGFLTDETIANIREGVRIGGRKVIPGKLSILARNTKQSRVEIQISEGLNREVRRIFATVGHEARKLKRIFIGPLSLKGISKGRARLMNAKELKRIKTLMINAGEIDKPAKKAKNKYSHKQKFSKNKKRSR